MTLPTLAELTEKVAELMTSETFSHVASFRSSVYLHFTVFRDGWKVTADALRGGKGVRIRVASAGSPEVFARKLLELWQGEYSLYSPKSSDPLAPFEPLATKPPSHAAVYTEEGQGFAYAHVVSWSRVACGYEEDPSVSSTTVHLVGGTRLSLCGDKCQEVAEGVARYWQLVHSRGK